MSLLSSQKSDTRRQPRGTTPFLLILGVLIFFVASSLMMVRDVSLLLLAMKSDNDQTASEEKSNLPIVRKERGLEEPISCYSFLQEARSNASYVDPNGGLMYVNQTIENPSFWVSLHNKVTDPVRWEPLVNVGTYYERALNRVWGKVLSVAPKGSHVLDVGGNIGFYSLFSASKGNFVIDAFEPADRNIMRFCEAVLMNKWMNEEELGSRAGEAPSVNIHPIGLSDTDGVLVFYELPSAPGSGSFAEKGEAAGMKSHTRRELPVMKLDTFAQRKGWFESRPNIEVLKIDVEGHGANVVLGGQDLIKSGLVQNLFTETDYHGDDAGANDKELLAVKLLLDAGYTLAGIGTWPGPGEKIKWPHDETLVDNLFAHLKTMYENQGGGHCYVNLWWSLKHKNEDSISTY